MPALVVERARKALPEGSAVLCLRPAPAGIAAVQSDDAPADAEFLAAEAVVVLGIVARVTEGGVDRDPFRSLAHGRGEVRRVLARTEARHGANDQVRAGVEHDGQLGPGRWRRPFPLARRWPKWALTCRVSRPVVSTAATGAASIRP